jgi:hypothetical protein
VATEADARKAALSLPDVTETAWGFRVSGRLFASINYRYGTLTNAAQSSSPRAPYLTTSAGELGGP